MTNMVHTYESTSRTVEFDGITIHYNDAGEGFPSILIHGGGPGATGWSNYRRNVDALSETGRVIVIDLPNYGRSSKVGPQQGLFGYYSRVVRSFMDTIGIERANFIGNSLGGGTSLKFAIDTPERAGKVVLMGAGGGLPIFSAMPTEGLRRMFGYYADGLPTREKLRAFIEMMVFDSSQVSDELLEERFQNSIDPEVVMAPSILPKNGKPAIEDLWREDLGSLQNEFLIIWGREDRVLPLDSAFILMNKLRNAQFHVFPNCGHWAQWERADDFNRIVGDFLAR
ncbi:alpha/beta fold hydrolase [Sphingosinicella microcystinivorans]|uniref:alpha/beta fold hydrolase n=1 Tax=Sphingosinicella microcystinivorans TaxID=335406 RepID=UPI0022F3FFFA|nr:alpha/beta fold hydrolase [Sphingosinicella microcystinivorans]WBX84144.1 alpha/beta fold hydrolase [Sphingosinicella microcystinivorans]